MIVCNDNFEKYLTKEEEEEIARGIARGEEDIKAGKFLYWEDFKKEIRRYEQEFVKRRKLHN